MDSVEARQRDRFGGINWGAAFFGWLVAIGIAALLTALVSAAGAAIAITEIDTGVDAIAKAGTIGIVGGIALFAVALIAYFGAGYVAGRMSRFDGARQGFGVWAWGLAIAVVLAIAGATAGEGYNLFADLDLPRIPIDEGDVTTGGAILLGAVLLGSLLAAIAGGKLGEQYHRRIDAAGYAVRAQRPAPAPEPVWLPATAEEYRRSVAESDREERDDEASRRTGRFRRPPVTH
jgi:hypothetical protein